MNASILIVDDEKATAWALAQGLADEGYIVSTVGRGEDAIRLAERQQYQLVITDVRLPDIDGVALARHLTQKDPNLPIILITAYDTPDLMDEAERAGACDVFPKPFRLDDIKASVRRALTGGTGQEIDRAA